MKLVGSDQCPGICSCMAYVFLTLVSLSVSPHLAVSSSKGLLQLRNASGFLHSSRQVVHFGDVCQLNAPDTHPFYLKRSCWSL
jgi:hypothetical protein